MKEAGNGVGRWGGGRCCWFVWGLGEEGRGVVLGEVCGGKGGKGMG